MFDSTQFATEIVTASRQACRKVHEDNIRVLCQNQNEGESVTYHEHLPKLKKPTSGDSPMMLVKIDYILIAVHNFEAAINYYQWVLNTTIDYQNLLTHADVKEAPMKVAESSISSSPPLSPTHPW